MIFSTNHQLNCFLILIFFGLIIGFIYSILIIMFLKNYQKKFIKLIFFSIFFTFLNIFFVFLINFFNYGKFSTTLLLGYVGGFILIKTLLNKSVVILENMWYNTIKKRVTKLISHFKTKDKKHENSIKS